MEAKKSKRVKNHKLIERNGDTSEVKAGKSVDSFDRFGDDLCELILSYLSFRDKIMMEEVSKQWQRCVYSKQSVLRVFSVHAIEMTPHMPAIYLNELLEPITVRNFVSGYAKNINMQTINKVALKSLLAKCRYIKKIELTRCFVDNEILELIGAYCPYLESILFDIIGLDERDIECFGRAFGARLKHLRFNMRSSFARDYANKFCNEFGKKLLTFCTNVKSFVCDDISNISDPNPNFLPKLNSLDLKLRRNDMSSFILLVDKYAKIKKLKIYSHELDQQNVRNALQQLSRLQNIEDLNVAFSLLTQHNTSINDKIVELAKNCPKLHRLVFTINTTVAGNDLINGNVFDCFGKFVHLKYLKVSFQVSEIKETVECFKRCTNLTHLGIRCPKIGDAFFENVGRYLPNLKCLEVKTELDLSDTVMNSLSKLPKLSRLSIGSVSRALKLITDTGVINLLNSCPDISDIAFYSRPNITTKTIDILIKLAERKSKTNIKFYCGFSRLGDEASFAEIDMNAYQGLAANLSIIIKTANLNANAMQAHMMLGNVGLMPNMVFMGNVANMPHIIQLNLNANNFPPPNNIQELHNLLIQQGLEQNIINNF